MSTPGGGVSVSAGWGRLQPRRGPGARGAHIRGWPPLATAERLVIAGLLVAFALSSGLGPCSRRSLLSSGSDSGPHSGADTSLRRSALAQEPPEGCSGQKQGHSKKHKGEHKSPTKKPRHLPNEKLRRLAEQEARVRAEEAGEGRHNGTAGEPLDPAKGVDTWQDREAGESEAGAPGSAPPLSDEEAQRMGLLSTRACDSACPVNASMLASASESSEDGLLPLRPLPPAAASDPLQGEFWRQPSGLGLRPCLHMSEAYRNQSREVLKSGRYIQAVVTGGLNQMRLQIGNAVVIARILGAALVVPVLQENAIWHDRSEFADVFDVAHFKRVLAGDVRVVTALPPRFLRTAKEEWMPMPLATPLWLIKHLRKPLKRDHVVLLRGLDQSISPNLPPDLQRLRCKVEFHALRFVEPIRRVAQRLVDRISEGGTRPYVALHLRLEKDVWVRTGCSPGLGPDLDAMVRSERERRPDLLTGRVNLTSDARRQAGLCPMTAGMVARLLQGLGAAGSSTRIFWAGGEPLGGALRALAPLVGLFDPSRSASSLDSGLDSGLSSGASTHQQGTQLSAPGALEAVGSELLERSGQVAERRQGQEQGQGHEQGAPAVYQGQGQGQRQGQEGVAGGGQLMTKESVALPGELEELGGNANMLAAVDLLVCLHSDVFMPSHGGNMAHVIKGHRAYFGHRKTLTPNKRRLVELLPDPNPYQSQRQSQLQDSDLQQQEQQLSAYLREAHRGLEGQPQFRTIQHPRRDPISYPAPECMCRS